MGKELQIKSPSSWIRRGLIVLAALTAGLVIATPFYRSHKEVTGNRTILRAVNTHDMAQHLAVMEQFDKMLRSGVLYPRWLPDVNKGYGLAWTNFYPPGFYYVTSLVNLAVGDWMKTLFLVSVLGLAASGLTLYLLARQFYGRLASAVAALVYMTAPYHVLDLYWRGAMPEFVGFVLAPLIIYFAYKLGAEGRALHYAGLGFFHGLFLMTHIPVAFLMTYALGSYAVVWAVRERDWRITFRVALGISVALLVSAIYWLPSLMEIKYAAEPFSSIFPYHGSYITLLSEPETFRGAINVSFAVQAAALLIAIAILRSVRQPAAAQPHVGNLSRDGAASQTFLWIVMGLATLFMSTSFSIYISKLMPKIDIASFAWRWLVLSSLFVSLVVGAAIERLRRSELSPIPLWVCRAAISAAIVLNIWITVQPVIVGALANPSFKPPPDYVEAGFIPKGANDPHDLPDTPRVQIEPQPGAAEITRWDPEYHEIHLNVNEPSEIRLKTYNFRGWVARVDGQRVPIRNDDYAAQLVAVPPGIHLVQVSFETTGPRIAGAVLSAIGLLTVLGLSLKPRAREQRAKSAAAEGAFDDSPDARGSTDAGIPIAGRFKRFAAILLVAVVGTAILVIATRFASLATTAVPSPIGTQTTAYLGPGVAGGSQIEEQEGRLHLAGRDSVMVALDDKAWDELIAALSGRDETALDSLTESGRVLKVANDTRVRVLQAVRSQKKIRILEGPYLMKEGWVGERWLK